MVHLVITHGRSQEFETPATLERQWSEDLRWGLERVDAPFAGDIPVAFAFYGDKWREDDADRERSTVAGERPTALQARLAGEMLAAAPGHDRERLGWDTLSGLVGTLDDALGVGHLALRWFVQDVDRYFSDESLRDHAIQRITDVVAGRGDDVVLLAHSLGTVVAYDALRRHPDLPVRGLVTFGSPLGLATVRDKLEETGGDLAFPDGLRRWANIYEARDFIAANIPLADHYPAADERRIEDAQSKGRRPSPLKLVSAHDARVYLSSVALGKATRSIVESLGHVSPDPPAAGGAAADVERSGPSSGVREEQDDEPPSRERATPASGDRRSIRRNVPAFDDTGDEGRSWGFDDTADDASWDNAGAMTDDVPTAAAASDDAVAANGEGDAGETRRVERAAAASFPPLVAPGSTHDLDFQIGRDAAGDVRGGIEAVVPVDAKTLDLTVAVQATRFAVVDGAGNPASAAMDVSLDLEHEDALFTGTFRLRAEDSANRVACDIHLRFLHDNTQVGAITLPTIIAKGATTEPEENQPATGTIHQHPQLPPGAELLLLVTRDPDDERGRGSETYEISAIFKRGEGDHPPIYRLGSFPIAGDAPAFAKHILSEFHISKELSKPERRSRINALGLELWNNLPREFRQFYWKHMHKKDIAVQICSDEPYIPWELVKPQRRPGGETAPMLGQAFPMARWEDERRGPGSIAVSEFVVLAPFTPADPLYAGQVEAAELAGRFNARREDPGSKEQVTRLFRSGGPQILHFTGHGKFEDVVADSNITLHDGSIDVVDVNNATFSRMTPPPFVFLNACEVGNQGWSLTQIGGWAEAFCRAGTTGFVGPYWAVSDKVARKAALVFYRSLRAGMTVGEAMREVRERFNEDEEHRYHPSWLAYSLHCHPNVRVTFPDTVAVGPEVT